MTQPVCLRCCAKHIGTARSLLIESKLGYPENYVFAIGELSLAEQHLVAMYPVEAEKIRAARKALEENKNEVIDWKELAYMVLNMMGVVSSAENELSDELKSWMNAEAVP